ncbi:hypothetical protein V1477_008695 [Vespula maculifrons]|uniref:Uncharacterized protein n=1 Tax=Vespula maculifrons TaxID=7453 RepID=A0ABD2CDS3_VESMC
MHIPPSSFASRYFCYSYIQAPRGSHDVALDPRRCGAGSNNSTNLDAHVERPFEEFPGLYSPVMLVLRASGQPDNFRSITKFNISTVMADHAGDGNAVQFAA